MSVAQTLRFAAVCAALMSLFGCPAPVTSPPPPPAPEVVSFTVSASEVSAGDKVTLSWETKNATSVTLVEAGRGVVSGAEGLSGSVEVTVQADTLYVLTAKNERGLTESAAAAVDVKDGVDQVLFVATPEDVTAGEPVTLAWMAQGASTVTLAEQGGATIDLGGQVESGTVTVTPTVDTVYELTVDGTAHQAAVRVRPAIDLFSVTPSAVLPNDTVTISWKVTGAAEVTVAVPGSDEVAHETDAAKVADGSATFHVPANIDPAGAITFRITAVNPAGDRTTTRDQVVYVAGQPKLREVSIPTWVREGGTYEVTWKTTGADLVEVIVNGEVVYTSANLALADAGSVTLPSPGATDQVVQVRAASLRGGEDRSDEVTVSAVGTPSVTSFEATPGTVATGGDPVALTWTIPNARHVVITTSTGRAVATVDGKAAGMADASVDDYPNVDTEYLLTADNGLGDVVTATASVQVTTPATLTFDPPTAPLGATVTVTGSTVNGGGDIQIGSAPPATPPFTWVVTATPIVAKVAVGTTGKQVEIDGITYPAILPNQLVISEVNYNPAAGLGEWFELENRSPYPFDLGGTTIDFGNGNTHTITGPLTIAAGGLLLFGSDPEAAEASAGGAAVDYVYGPGLTMPDAAGSLRLTSYGVTFASFTWNSPGTQGVATINSPGVTVTGGGTELHCAATTVYGQNGQLGTPGSPHPDCFGYSMSVGPANTFQSIMNTGTVVGSLAAPNDSDSVYVTLMLARPVKVFGQSYTTLYVSSNGFISTQPLSNSYNGNNSSPSTSAPNGVIAPFWDDLEENTGNSKVLYQQFDPDPSVIGDEYTIVSWENWKVWLYSTQLNFQVVFHEASGDIEFRYGAMTGADADRAHGISATTWLENAAGTAALVYNVNSATAPGIASNTSIYFTAR
ncbi:MAG: lamin tail domain-containing protein [Myxococcaceae bacterium]|nr:lamin tail domain-containing protein [Myxococcaceae bacterium]